jgi:hypothetical protein
LRARISQCAVQAHIKMVPQQNLCK